MFSKDLPHSALDKDSAVTWYPQKVVPSGREEISTSPNSGSAFRDASVTMTTQWKKVTVDGAN